MASLAGESALFRYFTLLQPGTTWQEAFHGAFGMTVDEFYELFKAHSEAGFPKLELSPVRSFRPVKHRSNISGAIYRQHI